MRYTLKIFKNGKLVRRSLTANQRRFAYFLRMINFQIKGILVYIKVDYGKSLDNFGKMTNFHNDGEYVTRKDLMMAFRAFTEK